jgi:CDP-diglyceride synthetase
MTDMIATYLIQFATVTVACLVLAEWGTPKALRMTKRPKMITALAYAVVLNALGLVGDLIVLPGEAWYEQLAALIVLSVVSMATASGVVAGKKRFIDKGP